MSAAGKMRPGWRCGGVDPCGNAEGFTLLELLVALAIMALITGIGFPAIQNRIDAAARTQARTALGLAAAEARSDAVAGARTVRLAASQGGAELFASAGRRPTALPSGATVAVPDGGFLFFADGTARGGVGLITAGTRHDRFAIDAMTGRIAFLP